MTELASYGDLKKTRPAVQVSREEFLESLSSENQANVEHLIDKISDYLSENHAVVAVGKTVLEETRGTDRKDIDLLLLLDGGSTYEDVCSLGESITKDGSFSIERFIQPNDDYDFGTSGSVLLRPKSGTPIELLSVPNQEAVQIQLSQMAKAKSSLLIPRDYCILSD